MSDFTCFVVRATVLLCFCFIISADCCARYFVSRSFKSKERRLNSSLGCQEPFTDQGVNFTGDRWCTELFAGRGFCKWKCHQDCNMESVTSIICDKMTSSRFPGSYPWVLHIKCNCTGKLWNSTESSCKTLKHTWREAELGHTQFCINGQIPPVYGDKISPSGTDVTGFNASSVNLDDYTVDLPPKDDRNATN